MLRVFFFVVLILAVGLMAMPSSNLRGYGSYGPAWLRRIYKPDGTVAFDSGVVAVPIDE